MLKEKMYVRCHVDFDEDFHRDFAIGQIKEIDETFDRVTVMFHDVIEISQYYALPKTTTYAAGEVFRTHIRVGAKVQYRHRLATVTAYKYCAEDELYYYYLQMPSSPPLYVCETELKATFVDSAISPFDQLKQYEFQNPIWYFGRSQVSRAMQTIINSMYGFKELAGCKISLKPYQLKTVMRCLQSVPCRHMLADEVGLGKTIEALSVLKVFLKQNSEQKALILVPDALLEQWRTEMAFKFRLFEGVGECGNTITIVPMSQLATVAQTYDFVIIDEVHRVVGDSTAYARVLELSKRTENILMLSATPIQNRREEYQKLLTLIQPTKYEALDKEEFNRLCDLQRAVMRRMYGVMDCLDMYLQAIHDNGDQRTEETEEVFEELLESLEDLRKRVPDQAVAKMMQGLSDEDEDFGVEKVRTVIAYVCETYQLEKSIIRNRRSILQSDAKNTRELETVSYGLSDEYNAEEYQVYHHLTTMADTIGDADAARQQAFLKLVQAFFSSAAAFCEELSKWDGEMSPHLIDSAEMWRTKEARLPEKIHEFLEDPSEYACRAVNVVDYIDQNTDLEKILVFTSHPATFAFYKTLLTEVFGEQCCFFEANLRTDERELQVYRFQNEPSCRIMLSDESGGEGRNFQHAHAVLHIDLPWSANMLEQRIGRLDRIGRQADMPVRSVVVYAEETTEEDLFAIWQQGLGVFEKSQSGLEIIMNELDARIAQSVCDDFRVGLNNMLPSLVSMIKELEEAVKLERHFDLAAYQYQTLNRLLEKTLEDFYKSETQYFSEAMMGWASLAGFVPSTSQEANSVRFHGQSFSVGSATNSAFVPPDMKRLLDDQLNQMRNRVRALNGERSLELQTQYIDGTFDRETALANDYIHFFAPGDEIFDSIVQNALGSYKGTCAAMEIPSALNWTGFIMNFKVELDPAKIYESGLQASELDKYRGYLPSDQYMVAVTVGESDCEEAQVLREIKELIASSKAVQKKITHIGSRRVVKGSCRMERFMSALPEERWHKVVEVVVHKARDIAKQQIAASYNSKLALLKKELLNEISTQKGAALYFGGEDDSARLKERNAAVYGLFQKPSIVLDSVCYVRMCSSDR